VSEHPAEQQPDERQRPEEQRDPTEQVEHTGHAEVDDVIASLDGLDDRPVAEHVEVFESAHDRLRGALTDPGDDPSGS
jgi:hypothetical protein